MSIDKTKLLVETVQQLSAARDLNKIMEIVRSAARQLTGADGATFVLKEGDKCFYADEDAIAPLWKGQRFPMDACISGWAMINARHAAIEDIYTDSRIPAEAYKPTFVKSLVMVPIRKMNPIGAIGNYWATPHKATEEEIFLLQSLADTTSVAIENVYLYAEMEERVKERTKQLEEANYTLQMFNNSVSHDLKAPLKNFQNYIDILTYKYRSGLDDTGKNIIDRLGASANNMNYLLAGLMSFSQVRSAEPVFEQIPMYHLVREICETTNDDLGNKRVAFEIKDLPPAFGDALLVRQVWVNLISNAVKYSSKKEHPDIEIGATDNNAETVYYVKDNGEGFDMQYYDKLFGVFQRLHSKEQFQGNGIGLALCEKIISKHNGRIWAESKMGEGATFYFALPKLEMPEAAIKNEQLVTTEVK
jgi:K+-sensing histidine kinase KdpD